MSPRSLCTFESSRFTPDQLISLEFIVYGSTSQSGAMPFDFSIDDLAFVP